MVNNKTLEQAVEEAVSSSRKAFHETKNDTFTLIRSAEIEVERLDNASLTSASSQFAKVIREHASKIKALFSRQEALTESFNIVLFGRTGAGKSTLIESLVRGTGVSVSPGESDWTTDVQPKIWGRCKVIDTPGINGWGRENNSQELEQRARTAVEIADFVILCFDSQSQQISEFAKVAAWVAYFNKPVIAVLNNRNLIWRLPTRVPVGSARASLSRHVSEHAVNIRDGLASYGMTAVPIVALSSARALFARASPPFEGPNFETFELHRQNYGIEKLEKWSNLHALEDLLVFCIEQNATTLRKDALNNQLRGVLNQLEDNVVLAAKEAREQSRLIETQTIEPLLKLLGYPDLETTRLPYIRQGVDLLDELEKLRGRFQAPSVGEFKLFVQHNLAAELGKLRSKSLTDAEELVISAFDQGKQITGDKLQAKCIRTTEMEGAAQRVMEESCNYMNRRTRLAYRDGIADLKAHLRDMADIEGDAGTGWKYGAWGLRSSGVFVGVIGALGSMAAVNIWNPLGWTLGVATVVALTGGSIAGLFGWVGANTRKKAEKEKLIARRKALANVRKTIHEVYEEFTTTVNKEAINLVIKTSGEAVLPAVEQALDLRRLAAAGDTIASDARKKKDNLPQQADSQRLVWEAKELAERAAEPESVNADARYWLGESWIDDPEGLQKAYEEADVEKTLAYEPTILASMFTGLRHVWNQVTGSLKPGSGIHWLAQTKFELADDNYAQTALGELESIAARGRPRLHIVGDYNAGKSSFIKRLLSDAGEPIPDDLRIGANPTTEQERIYELGKIDIVDVPGFQSSNKTHTEVARHSFPDASTILYLFQPNLVIGKDDCVRLVLNGDRKHGLVPKAQKTFFIINRSDELGIDPVDNPHRYKELAERKQRELAEALRHRGVEVDPRQILCMSSDPFGLVGDRKDTGSKAYDAHRDWDGFESFISSYRDIERELLRTGVDRSILEGGLARLAQLEAWLSSESNQLSEQSNAISSLIALVSEHKAEGIRLVADARAKLTRSVEDHVEPLKNDILSENDPQQVVIKSEHANRWWEDEDFKVNLERWSNETQKSLDEWRARIEGSIDRRLGSAEFAKAFPDANVSDAPRTHHKSKARKWFRDTFANGQVFARGATPRVVYDIGKFVGFKFRPWGAVKLARNLGKAGAVMAIVGVAWDTAEIFVDEHRQGKREDDRKKITEWLTKSCPKIVEAIADGDEEEHGILKTAHDYIELVDDYLTELQKENDEKLREITLVEERRRQYQAAMQNAEWLLGGNVWE